MDSFLSLCFNGIKNPLLNADCESAQAAVSFYISRKAGTMLGIKSFVVDIEGVSPICSIAPSCPPDPLRSSGLVQLRFSFRYTHKNQVHWTGIVTGLEYGYASAIGKRCNAPQVTSVSIIHGTRLVFRLHVNSNHSFSCTNVIKLPCYSVVNELSKNVSANLAIV